MVALSFIFHLILEFKKKSTKLISLSKREKSINTELFAHFISPFDKTPHHDKKNNNTWNHLLVKMLANFCCIYITTNTKQIQSENYSARKCKSVTWSLILNQLITERLKFMYYKQTNKNTEYIFKLISI